MRPFRRRFCGCQCQKLRKKAKVAHNASNDNERANVARMNNNKTRTFNLGDALLWQSVMHNHTIVVILVIICKICVIPCLVPAAVAHEG